MVSDSASSSIDDIPIEDRTPEDHNQVEVQMNSGELHKVEYVLRHPDRDWVYAGKIIDTEGTNAESRDLILRVENIEMISSAEVTIERRSEGEPVDPYLEPHIWVHHTVPYEYVSTDVAFKTWCSDAEMK